MSLDSQTQDKNIELNDTLIDSSISDAKWLLGSVATLGLFVFLVGLFASTLTV